MDSSLSTILFLVFWAIVGLFSLLAVLSVYIYVRYGRTRSVTLTSSAVFISLFLIGVGTALVSLQNFISTYGA
jgi:hypothetical protein